MKNWWEQSASTKPVLKSTRYHQSSIIKRPNSKGLYELAVVLSWADLDLISPDDAEHAITYNKPYRNPLKWTLVAVNKDKRQLKALHQEITRTGSVSQAVASLGIVLSSTEWTIAGASG